MRRWALIFCMSTSTEQLCGARAFKTNHIWTKIKDDFHYREDDRFEIHAIGMDHYIRMLHYRVDQAHFVGRSIMPAVTTFKPPSEGSVEPYDLHM